MKTSPAGNSILPNTFQHPNIFIDRLMYYLTPEENVVLTFAVRRILGFQENISSRKDHISLSQFVEGIKSSKDGSELSKGCGLGTNAVRRALYALHKFNILLPTTKKADARRGQEYWLQDNENEIAWDRLEKRQEERLERERGRTERARSVVAQQGQDQPQSVVGQHSTPAVAQQPRESVAQQARVLSDNNTKPRETQRNPEREPALDFKDMTVPQARKVWTLRMYARAAEFFPGSILWEYVHNFIRDHQLTEQQIRDAAVAWAGRGYRQSNVQGILEWALNGVPANGSSSKTEPGPAIDEKRVEVTRETLDKKWAFQPAPPPTERPRIATPVRTKGRHA